MDVLTGRIVAPSGGMGPGAPGFARGRSPEDTGKLALAHATPHFMLDRTLDLPGASISGYITGGPDPSLLPKLNDKVFTIKDFTAILQM